MQYIKGSMKRFDFPSHNVFIDESYCLDKSYMKIKDHVCFKAINKKALRIKIFTKYKNESFKSVKYNELKPKMIQRLRKGLLHTYQINNVIDKYPQLSFFLPFDFLKREKVGSIDNEKELYNKENLFVFSKNMTASEEKELRDLGIENFDHLNEEDIQVAVAYSLRNLYNKMKEDGIDNEEELIDVLSLKFGIKRPVLRKIFNNEIHPSEEIKDGKIKDGSSFNEAEIEFLHKAFFPTLIKDEETLQDYIENKNGCYNYLYSQLTDRALLAYDNEIVLEEIKKYFERKVEQA